MTEGDVMTALCDAIADETGEASQLSRDQTALDVPGWDSLAHVRIMMNLEARLGVQIDIDRTYRARTIGDLLDLVQRL